MASLANKDEAEKCRDMAKKFLERGDREKAVRFFEKSLKLYPLPGVETMRDLAKQSGRGEAPSSEQTRPNSGSFSANANGHMPNNSGSSRGSFDGDTRGSPGARRRPAASGGAAAEGGSATANGGSSSNGGRGGGGGGGGGSGRAYTEEQDRAARKVIDSKAKGHYAVLGVEKDASEDQIKRAYRKLALRFHPDKNGAPKAHEAFQAIGTAFAVLSDAEKRAHYDRFGDDDGPQGMAGGFGRGPFGAHGRYRGGPEVSPEDIFNMFFGGMAPGGEGDIRRGGAGPFRVYRAGGGARGRGAQQQQQGGSFMNLLALLPFMILMLLTLFGGQREDIFSLNQTSRYSFEKVTTQNTGVVEGIHYYVGPGFRTQYARTREQLRRVEAQVTSAYKGYLRSECLEMQTRREKRIMKARQRRRTMTSEAYEQLMNEAETMPLPPCEELMSKFNFFSRNY